MDDVDKFRLLASYQTPCFWFGQRVSCQVRGELIIIGISEAPIPWPIGKSGKGAHSLVVYEGLAHAIHNESSLAIQYWWYLISASDHHLSHPAPVAGWFGLGRFIRARPTAAHPLGSHP
jgi:hypothetical protein